MTDLPDILAGQKVVQKATSLASNITPLSVDPGLEHRVKFLRRLIEKHRAHDQPRRIIERPAQRDAKVYEVPAHAVALHEHRARSGRRIAAAGLVGDAFVQPIRSRLDAADAVRQVTDKLLRSVRHDIGFA